MILSFQCTLSSANPHIPPPKGTGAWETAAGNPNGGGGALRAPAVAAPQGNSDSQTQVPGPKVGAPPVPSWLFQERMLILLLVLHTHIHIPKPRNSDPLPRDLGLPHCYTSAWDRHLRQTSIQDELPDCCPGEPALQPHTAFAAGKTGLNAKQMLFSRSLLGGGGGTKLKATVRVNQNILWHAMPYKKRLLNILSRKSPCKGLAVKIK